MRLIKSPLCGQNSIYGAFKGFSTHHTPPCTTIHCSLTPHQQPTSAKREQTTTRRLILSTLTSTLTLLSFPQLPSLAADTSTTSTAEAAFQQQLLNLRRTATEAYAKRDFTTAVNLISSLIQAEPKEPRWREMRAQALVDGKNFADALRDFDSALKLLPDSGASLDRARILSGKGLALEGLGDWVAALDTYTECLNMAEAVGSYPDPYILNSRGNCHASLGEWKLAREDYLASARGFQTARRADASLQQRLDGNVFSQSNAALMLAQLGDDKGAIKEIQGIARKAPGSADMRAALAALYWSAGQESAAESEWEFACNKIVVGCVKYQDMDWLFRIRRWPPVMIDKMREFLALRSSVKKFVDSGDSDVVDVGAGFRE